MPRLQGTKVGIQPPFFYWPCLSGLQLPVPLNNQRGRTRRRFASEPPLFFRGGFLPGKKGTSPGLLSASKSIASK